jgi:hypothetical protein
MLVDWDCLMVPLPLPFWEWNSWNYVFRKLPKKKFLVSSYTLSLRFLMNENNDPHHNAGT